MKDLYHFILPEFLAGMTEFRGQRYQMVIDHSLIQLGPLTLVLSNNLIRENLVRVMRHCFILLFVNCDLVWNFVFSDLDIIFLWFQV